MADNEALDTIEELDEEFEELEDGIEYEVESGSQGPSQGLESVFEKNRNVILGVVAAIILVIAGVLWYVQNKETKNKEAQTAILSAINYFESGRQDSLAIFGDGVNDGFESIVSDYGGTPTGNLAKMYMGLAYLRMGNLDEGIDALERVSGTDDMLTSSVYSALGYAYEEQGNFSKAANYYEKAAYTPEENAHTTPALLMDAARNHEAADDWSDALSIYKKIKKKFPNAPVASQIEKYIARAESHE